MIEVPTHRYQFLGFPWSWCEDEERECYWRALGEWVDRQGGSGTVVEDERTT